MLGLLRSNRLMCLVQQCVRTSVQCIAPPASLTLFLFGQGSFSLSLSLEGAGWVTSTSAGEWLPCTVLYYSTSSKRERERAEKAAYDPEKEERELGRKTKERREEEREVCQWAMRSSYDSPPNNAFDTVSISPVKLVTVYCTLWQPENNGEKLAF